MSDKSTMLDPTLMVSSHSNRHRPWPHKVSYHNVCMYWPLKQACLRAFQLPSSCPNLVPPQFITWCVQARGSFSQLPRSLTMDRPHIQIDGHGVILFCQPWYSGDVRSSGKEEALTESLEVERKRKIWLLYGPYPTVVEPEAVHHNFMYLLE